MSVGGEDYKQMVLALLKRVLSKQLAEQYSTYGRKGKRSLAHLNIYSAVKRKCYASGRLQWGRVS